MLFRDNNVAVVDLTHGGIPLARSIAHAARSVTAVDIYGTVDGSVLAELEKYGINTTRTVPADPDLVVAPIHLDPDLIPGCEEQKVITHHRAVGELLPRLDARVIEITGTGGKTSTAALLADMASRSMSVISHTSRGVEHWKNGVPQLVHRGLSIAPGSVLTALEYCEGMDPDMYIFEISLGGTGAADLGIITSLDNEYTIAGGHRTSTRAKSQMVEYAKTGSTLLVNARGPRLDPPSGVDMITFGTAGDVYLEDPNAGVWTISYPGGVIRFRPNEGYDPRAYTTAMVCATAAAVVLELEPGIIEQTLLDFQGVHGRMRLVEWAGRTMVDNSNSGMNLKSVEEALKYSSRIAGNDSRLLFILGEEAKQVCEGLDPDGVADFVRNHGHQMDQIILVGHRMHAIKGDNIHHADDLNKAIEMAESLTREKDIIVSCVKCFR